MRVTELAPDLFDYAGGDLFMIRVIFEETWFEDIKKLLNKRYDPAGTSDDGQKLLWNDAATLTQIQCNVQEDEMGDRYVVLDYVDITSGTVQETK